MPRLVKGGKWVYGWTVVGPEQQLTIPPRAGREYGLQPGDVVFFLPGSRRSGGFSLCKPGRSRLPLEERALGRGLIAVTGQVRLPAALYVGPGQRLLAVRGSGLGLGFVAQGPIYQEALRHPELQVFAVGTTTAADEEVRGDVAE
jgi:hypothetical protein